MRAWRAAAASLIVGVVLLVLGALLAVLGHLDRPGSVLIGVIVPVVAVLTALYLLRTRRMLRAAAPAPEALLRPGRLAVQVPIELADDLFVPVVFALLLDGRSLWFAMILLLALGLRHALEGALIARWERRHGAHVLRTGGFFRPDRLILAH